MGSMGCISPSGKPGEGAVRQFGSSAGGGSFISCKNKIIKE